ncbi:MAG TPA: hypothetical protein VMV69_24720 [Pirellulales bacterium]|nr:hypothetical protein [Pirellulales bacterium]
MRFSGAVATAVCVFWTVAGQAQYYGQSGPTLLPVPRTSVPANAYQRGAAAGQYGAAPDPTARGEAVSSRGYAAPTPGSFQPSYASTANDIWNDTPSGEAVPTPAPSQLWDDSPSSSSSAAPGTSISGNDPTDPYQDALMSGCDDTVVGLPWGGTARPNLWFGSVAGIVMTRDNSNKLWTSFNVLNPAEQVLNTQQASGNWQGGGQVMIGRWFGCRNPCGGYVAPRYGIQAVYWGLAPMQNSASITSAGNNLNTPINLGYITLGPSSNPTQNNATQYFDNAQEHRILRTDNIQSVEFNLVQRVSVFDGAPRMMFTNLVGVRYFHFSDNVVFGSVAGGHNFGDNGGADEAYLANKVINNMLGLQIGTRLDYFVVPRLRLFAAPTFGVLANHLTGTSQLNSGDGLQGYNNFSGASVPYNSRSSTNTASLLGQIDIGAGWQITPRFSAFASYRAVAISRVGQADNQFTPFLADAAGIRDIQSNGDLILHGAVIGGQWNY